MSLEIIPIGTILAVLTSQVIKTANAATEVVFEKESFKVLSKHLLDIEPVLKELQLQELNDSQAARFALISLENDVKKANNLVEKYRNRSRFYLLLKCRHIVNEIQEVTRDIGSSLRSLSLANTEVLSRISDQVNRLHNEMQRVEFETSRSQDRILDRLNQGLRDHKLDRAFANDMLEEIALAVGVPIEPSEISRELTDFRKEKEDAAYNKQRADEFFLGQVIELLSRADAARDYEEVKKQYECRVRTMERYEWREECVRPLNSFLCRITGNLMVDPVSLCTGTTCERAAIVARFESGDRTDPETREVLGDISLRSNLPLRQSIEEWRELRYCYEIRSLKNDLLSGVGASIVEALSLMQGLMEENAINRDWLSVEGLTDILVSILEKKRYEYLKREVLITLKVFVEGHSRNKEEVIDSRGWNHIVLSLGCDSTLSEASIELLYELLQERSGWNVSVCRKLSQEPDSISDLIALFKDSGQETARTAEKILRKLLEVDEDNYSRAAKAGWFEPLVDCIVKGPETSRVSMVKAVVKMELDDSELKLLGKEGVIPILIEMASGNMEWKDLSLSALAKLSSSEANRHLIAKSGGVRFVVGLMLSPLIHTLVTVKCCEILEKISSSEDAIGFFVDENGVSLDLESIVTNLLILLQTQNSANSIRRPALRTLLEVCKFEAGLVKKAILTIKDLSQVLPFLDDSDSEIREIAVKLLFLFSQHEQDGIVEYLLRPRRVEALVGFLENEGKDDVKLAVAGLLVNLPKSATKLNEALIACNAHMALVNILKTTGSTEETKENSLGALFRLTDPESLESQRAVVRAGAHPLLVELLRAGSITAKARAAGLLGNLSASSQKLTDTSRSGFWRCFSPKGISLCPAHGGVCSAESSFCLVDSDALPGLVELLIERVPETAEEAISALSTLVNEAAPGRGAAALHRAGAIQAVVESVNWGSTRVKDKALGLLEKVFASREMAQNYLLSARFVLVGISGASVGGNDGLVRKATKILALLERNSRSSMSFLSRSSGRIAT